MGSPATPTPADRASIRDLSRRIVEAVRDDEPWPDEVRSADDRTYRDTFEALLMQMAQEIVTLTAERDAVWSRLDNWDWRGLLRDAQRGDFTSVKDALRDVVAMDESREEALTAEVEVERG